MRCGSPLAEQVGRWIIAARANPARAPTTITRYAGVLVQLVAFVQDAHPGASARNLDKHVFRAFLARLRPRLAQASVAVAIVALRAFLRWLQRNREVDRNVALELVRPKLRPRAPVVINVDQVAAVLGAPPATSAAGLRDRAALELLYAAGLHARELVALDLDHVQLDAGDGLGAVRVAGRLRQRVPIGSAAVAALRVYLARRDELVRGREGAPAPRALFLGRAGARVSGAALRRLVRVAGDRAECPKLTPARLRHACAVHLLDGGADLRVVQVVMGHATVATTDRYVELAVDALTRVYDAAHPLARRTRKT